MLIGAGEGGLNLPRKVRDLIRDLKRAGFDELCRIVDETIENYTRDGKPLPRPMSGKQFVSAMQSVA